MVADVLPARGVQVQFALTHALIQSLLVIIMRMMMVVAVMMMFLMAMMHTSYLSQTRQTLSVEQKKDLDNFCSTLQAILHHTKQF